ncbi:MAG: hypothetical protein HWN81_02075 [Candidatus Lokiarchaeota archaeon]|nr:hypothetical protein [Candidatus Lokiarchaeota archaeon]
MIQKIISHRANIKGPNKDLENNPEQILKVLKMGFDCEIDVWFVDNKFYLGHDEPQYETDYNFLSQTGLWIHCKNFKALITVPISSNYFWHEEDDYTLTSKRYIWTYPNKIVEDNCIIVDNNVDWINKGYNCFGVCTDYIK